jgi:antitoxin ChpS
MARTEASAKAKALGKQSGADGATSQMPARDVRAYATLKPAGGSLVMTVPAIIRKALHFAPGAELAVTVEGTKMVVEAVAPAVTALRARRPKYTLDELLADSNPDAPLSEDERTWHDAAPVGREVW